MKVLDAMRSNATQENKSAYHCILQETKAVFEKLHKFLGKNLKNLVEQKDEDYVFRLHKNRIYYVRESLLRRATNVSTRKDKQPLEYVEDLHIVLPLSPMLGTKFS